MSDISTPKKGPGKPTKYRKEYCDLLVEHMKSGLSYESFAAIAKCCRETLYDWEKVHPEWKEAKRKAFHECQLFWEKAGLEGMFMGGRDNPFNATVWIFNMKNRFNWGDRVHQEVKGELTLENLVSQSMKDQNKE